MATRGRKKKVVIERDQLVLTAVEMLKKSNATNYVKRRLVEMSESKYGTEEIDEIFKEAKNEIDQRHFSKPHQMKLIHFVRYRRLIDMLFNTPDYDESLVGKPIEKGGISPERFQNQRKLKIKAMNTCLDTMNNLETLINVTCETQTSVEINHDVNITIQNQQLPGFVTKRLTFDEAKEYLVLLEKAKVGYVEPISVKEVIDDVVAEEVIATTLPEVVNIDEIKQIAPVQTKQLNTRQRFEELKRIVQQRSSIEALERLSKAGANLDATEKEMLSNK